MSRGQQPPARPLPSAVGARPAPQAPGGYNHPPPSTTLVAHGLADHGLVEGDDVDLATSYELCRRLNAAHGKTYYFAARFLPAASRPHVHALYAFARYADDLVDHFELSWDPAERRRALEQWSGECLATLDAGKTTDPVLAAALHTVRTLGIPRADLEAFLRSMAMDLTVTRYQTYEDLAVYVHGSAAVIGSMMVPVLAGRGAPHRSPRMREPAMDLGVAFQLTNFLRDVAEDFERGRIYLPLEDLERFDVTEADLGRRTMTPGLRRLLAFEAARARELYARAEAGWSMLTPRSRLCIRIAQRLYGEILDRLERQDWDVFGARASVSTHRRVAVALQEIVLPSKPRRRGRSLDTAHL